MNTHFTPEHRGKLIKLLRLMASDHLGERAAAASRAHSLIVATESDWDQLIAPAKAPNDDLALFERAKRGCRGAKDWDQQFLIGIGAQLRSGLTISDAQRKQLNRIVLEAEARAA